MNMFQEMAKFYQDGGWWMHPITATSILALGVLVERFVFVFLKYNINGNAFMAQVQKLVMANNIDRAIKLCSAANDAALPRIIKAGLTRANKGEAEIVNAIDEATLEVMPLLTKRTNTLAALANIATMFGLLGTITGLIDAFAALEKAAPDQKQQLLAKSISIAMNTTAYGLIVAIPALAAHLLLTSTTQKIVSEIDEYSVKLQNLLFARARGELTDRQATS